MGFEDLGEMEAVTIAAGFGNSVNAVGGVRQEIAGLLESRLGDKVARGITGLFAEMASKAALTHIAVSGHLG